LGRSRAKEFLLAATVWSLLGALLGLAIAIAVYGVFRRLGWYDAQSNVGVWIRRSVLALTVMIAPVLFGLTGFWSGLVKGSEVVLRSSQLGTQVFPWIANTIADGMGWLQLRTGAATEVEVPELTAHLEAFRSGAWELNASQFLQQLDRVQEAQVNRAITWLEEEALAKAPGLKGGLAEEMLRQSLRGLGRLIVEGKVSSELKRWGVDRVYRAILEKLIAEAARAGDPQTIKHAELSAFIVREGIVPGILNPIRSTARSQQVVLLLIAAGVLFGPPVIFRVVRGRRKARPAPPVSAPPPQRSPGS
jgi:hypothetical protein